MADKGFISKKVGDWEKVKMIIASLADDLKAAQLKSITSFGLKGEQVAKGHISKQDLPWKPLSPATIAAKIRKGYSENILVETSQYFQSITTWVDGDVVYVGVKKEVKNEDGVVIANIAKIHEYGSQTGGIPARPLWKPTLEDTLIWHYKYNRPEKRFFDEIKKRL